MAEKFFKKGILGLGLAFFAAGIGLISFNASAINGGSQTCDALKSTLRSDSSETGSVIITLSENCTANLYVRSGQAITLDTVGHTLTSSSGATITVEKGGSLVLNNFSEIGTVSGTTAISNSGKVEIKAGNILGNIVEVSGSGAETTITGGTFSINPSSFVPDGYTVEKSGNNYVVVVEDEQEQEQEQEQEGSGSSFDVSKVTASNDNLRNALIQTLLKQVDEPDTSSLNGRMVAQLLDAVNRGHTISASLVIKPDPELTEDAYQIILQDSAGYNLASIYDVSYVVTDLSNPSLTVSLTELSASVTVTFPTPSQYKAALSTRSLLVINVHEDDGEYQSSFIDDATTDANGDVAFETTKFSLFSLAYDGEPIAADGTEYDAVPQTDANSSDGDINVPDTSGFGLDLTVFHLLIGIGGLLIFGIFLGYAIRRAYARRRISLK